MDLGAIGERGQGEEATFKKDNLALMNWAKQYGNQKMKIWNFRQLSANFIIVAKSNFVEKSDEN